jgi:hypothetical protein
MKSHIISRPWKSPSFLALLPTAELERVVKLVDRVTVETMLVDSVVFGIVCVVLLMEVHDSVDSPDGIKDEG